MTASTDGSVTTTSAVAGMPSNNDISPTHVPASVTTAIGMPPFSMRNAPSSNTYNVATGCPSAMSTSPGPTERRA